MPGLPPNGEPAPSSLPQSIRNEHALQPTVTCQPAEPCHVALFEETSEFRESIRAFGFVLDKVSVVLSLPDRGSRDQREWHKSIEAATSLRIVIQIPNVFGNVLSLYV